MMREYKEGDRCPSFGCSGVFHYPPGENCSCHISPPCSGCVDSELRCDTCGWDMEDLYQEPRQVSLPGFWYSGRISV